MTIVLSTTRAVKIGATGVAWVLHLGVDTIFGSSLLLVLILSILVQGFKKLLSGRMGQVDFFFGQITFLPHLSCLW